MQADGRQAIRKGNLSFLGEVKKCSSKHVFNFLKYTSQRLSVERNSVGKGC